jgi:hypothetical protein
MPTYDKLWLQPLVFMSVAASIVAREALASSEASGKWNRIFLWAGLGLVVLMAVTNVSAAAYERITSVPYLSEAERAASIVSRRDLLVGDWNTMAILHQYIWSERDNTFNVPTDAIHHGRLSANRLEERIAQTERAGGRSFSLAYLTLPQPSGRR